MSKDRSLRELVLAAQRGEVAAFEELFRIFQGIVYNTILQMVSDPNDAEDITQETFLRAWERLPELSAPEAFRNWLLSIAINLCRSHFRKGQREPTKVSLDEPAEREDMQEGEGITVIDGKMDVEEAILERERVRLIRRAVASLPLSFQEVIVLHYFEGLEVADIAKVLGVPIGTVKSRLARAREMLRKRLEQWL